MKKSNDLILITESKIKGFPFQIEFDLDTYVATDLSNLVRVLAEAEKKIKTYSKEYRDISFKYIFRQLAEHTVQDGGVKTLAVGCGVDFESSNPDCNIYRGCDNYDNPLWDNGKITSMATIAKLV